jgi:hypothetical protein
MEPKKIKIKDVLHQYIKNKNGTIFHMTQREKNKEIVYLRSKNNSFKHKLKDLRQGLVDKTWFDVNEGELKSWIEKDNRYIEQFTRKLIKRSILAQLLTELDDELISENESDNRLRAVLTRSNKETERIAAKMYDRMYLVDKVTLQNLSNQVDDLTSAMASIDIIDMPYLKLAVERFIENIEEHRKEPIEFVEID